MLSLPHENSGQKPTPMFAAIMLRTAAGLSLSKTMLGTMPVVEQYLSQMVLSCFEPSREMKLSSFTSFSESDFIPWKRAMFGTAR